MRPRLRRAGREGAGRLGPAAGCAGARGARGGTPRGGGRAGDVSPAGRKGRGRGARGPAAPPPFYSVEKCGSPGGGVFRVEGAHRGTLVSPVSARGAQAGSAPAPRADLRPTSRPRPASHPHTPPAVRVTGRAPWPGAPEVTGRGRLGRDYFSGRKNTGGLQDLQLFQEGESPLPLKPLGFLLLFGKTYAKKWCAPRSPAARCWKGRAGSPAVAQVQPPGRRGAGPLPVLGQGRPAGPQGAEPGGRPQPPTPPEPVPRQPRG